VLDHARRRRARVPEERVEVRDVDEQEVVAVGGGMAHLGDPALRRVVLDVDAGGRGPGAARPRLAERSSSCGRWSTTTSNGSSRSALGRQLA
jgi:hypothetical protein